MNRVASAYWDKIDAERRFESHTRKALVAARHYSPGVARREMNCALDVLNEIICNTYADNSHLWGGKIIRRHVKLVSSMD